MDLLGEKVPHDQVAQPPSRGETFGMVGDAIYVGLGSLYIEENTMPSHVTHPYIESTLAIAGTNLPVSSVAFYILRHGMQPEELVGRFPHLATAQVYDALSYYYDHQAEIEKNPGQDALAAQLPLGEILSR
jgi:uncharacterized protein (DUF433 family)